MLSSKVLGLGKFGFWKPSFVMIVIESPCSSLNLVHCLNEYKYCTNPSKCRCQRMGFWISIIGKEHHKGIKVCS